MRAREQKAQDISSVASVLTFSNLPMSAQTSLKDLWLHGKDGCLSAREQLKASALREAWQEMNHGVHGMHTWIAERLTGGKRKGGRTQEEGDTEGREERKETREAREGKRKG